MIGGWWFERRHVVPPRPVASDVNERGETLQVLLLISILLNLMVGAIIFVSPTRSRGFGRQPDAFPKAWPRHGGCSCGRSTFSICRVIGIPRFHRWPNWCGIVIRLMFSAFFLSQGDGFSPMGIYDGLWD
jgi:hypothetical protein